MVLSILAGFAMKVLRREVWFLTTFTRFHAKAQGRKVYSLYLYTRLMNGNLTSYLKNYSDLLSYEIYISITLIFFIIFFGFMPNFILELLSSSHFLILERIKF